MPDRDEIESAFCILQAHGWVAGAEEVERNGLWHIEPEDGPWRLDDAYRRGSDWSVGSTSLTYDGEVVLFMAYSGYYKKEARQFLKNTLREAYEAGTFLGGRGPSERRVGLLHYHNFLGAHNSRSFAGREEIYVDSTNHLLPNDLLGYHEYLGMIFPS